jgi:hypothetical protein
MPSTIQRVMSATATAIQSFREAYTTSDPLAVPDKNDFGNYGSRKLRYSLLWSFFENSAYRDVHSWASKMKVDYGLYKFTRSVMGPAYDIGSFWHTYLMGGFLDVSAGDGRIIPSCIPIETENEKLRAPISVLLRDSKWQTNKDTLSLWGSVLGDVAIQIVDDPVSQKVFLKLVHPSQIKYVSRDLVGSVTSYIFEETRIDPEDKNWIAKGDSTAAKTCTYAEVCEKDAKSENIYYSTYRNGQPYKWNGIADAWTVTYGFVPLVLIQHLNVGMDWGWSELHSGLSKFREIDDLCSKVSDQIRKTVDAPWLFSGVSKPTAAPSMAGAVGTTTRVEPRRDEIPTLYGPVGAEAKPLIADMQLADVVLYIDRIMGALERDYPEIRVDTWKMTGDTSGNALRVNRQSVEVKVQMRRPAYDDGVKKAIQMGIQVGSLGNYPGYEGFSADSFILGDLEFNIGRRPVFSPDALDILAEKQLFWNVAQVANAAGMPLPLILKDLGWKQANIDEVVLAKEEAAQKALETMQETNEVKVNTEKDNVKPDNSAFKGLPLGKNAGDSPSS